MYYLYLIEAKGHYDGFYHKVGISDDPLRRLEQLQGMNPLKLTLLETKEYATRESARKAELEAHRSLEYAHLRGEWFMIPLDALEDLRGDFNF